MGYDLEPMAVSELLPTGEDGVPDLTSPHYADEDQRR